jgi:hypothetical protein
MKLFSSYPNKQQWKAESLSSVWAYLIEHGQVDPDLKTFSCLEGIRDIGIKWEDTNYPQIISYSDFSCPIHVVGNFKIILQGVMTLNDNTWYTWICNILPPQTNLNSLLSINELIERKLK